MRGLLNESKVIGSDEVDIYVSSKYRVTTIPPFNENPVMNVFLFPKEELNVFLEEFDQYAEFLVSAERGKRGCQVTNTDARNAKRNSL